MPEALPTSQMSDPKGVGGSWLGRRDSNPDNGVQSAVSYR